MYGGYFLVIAAIYLTMPLIRLIMKLHLFCVRCCQKKDIENEFLADPLDTVLSEDTQDDLR